MASGGTKAIIAAFFANLGIAAAKFVGFALTGAASMLAEAVHSLADTGNQGLLLLGAARAKRRPTPTHPFGYGRERYFWAFVVAIVIFALGGVFAIVEGLEKLLHPHELQSPTIAAGILLFAIALEGWSFRTALVEARPLRGQASWWAFIRHTKAAELPVVLLEDLGALLGLVLALAGVGLSQLTGDPRFDALGSIAIGVLLAIIAAILAIEMRGLLIGESASEARLARIEAALLAGTTVRRLIHMKTSHLGPEEILVGIKAEFEPTLSLAELAREIDAAEGRIRDAVPVARVIYIEPDVFRPPAA